MWAQLNATKTAGRFTVIKFNLIMTDNNSIKNFEEWNESYVKKYDIDDYYAKSNFFVRLIEKKRIGAIIKFLEAKDTDKIIELGCGAGHVLEKISNGALTGLDLSETMLLAAKKRLEESKKVVALLKGDAERLPCEVKSKKFDKIICSEVLEHTPRPEAVIDEIFNIAASEAVVIISIPNEKVINRLKQIIIKLGIFSFLFHNTSKKMDEEWHLHAFDLPLLKKISQGKLAIKKVRAVPFWFLPIRYVVQFELKQC